METRLTVSNALAQLRKSKEPFKILFNHGSLQVEIYKPENIDEQQPHSRDEIYVVACGSGHFINGETKHPVECGEVLFVPVGVVHKFVDFTVDFAVWVFFYGPEGGEPDLHI